MIKRILASSSTAILLTLSTFCIKNPFVKLPATEGGAGSTVGYGFPFEWYGVNKSTNPVISLFYSTGFIFDIAIFFLLFFVIFSVFSRKKDDKKEISARQLNLSITLLGSLVGVAIPQNKMFSENSNEPLPDDIRANKKDGEEYATIGSLLSKGGKAKALVISALAIIAVLLIIQGVLFWRETGVLLWR